MGTWNREWRWRQSRYFCSSCYYGRIYCWACFESYNLPSLLLKICTCSTIWGCATIKINHENKVICTHIVMHWAIIWICATNWVSMVAIIFYICSAMHSLLEYLKIENLKKLSRDWSLLQKVRKQGIIFWHRIFLKV